MVSEWVNKLNGSAAHVRDVVERELSASNPPQARSSKQSTYILGDIVLFVRPGCHQKLLPPFEPGWKVEKSVSPSTVVISHANGAETVVNTDCKGRGDLNCLTLLLMSIALSRVLPRVTVIVTLVIVKPSPWNLMAETLTWSHPMISMPQLSVDAQCDIVPD